MLHKGCIYYKDREKIMSKYGVDIPEFPIVPDSTVIFIAFDDTTKQCIRFKNIYKFIEGENNDCLCDETTRP